MSSTLESEDLENVQLVRMEDVQPSRERPCEDVNDPLKEEALETCIVDGLEYDNECVVENNDEDSNIGSMVSIHSEEVNDCDDGSTELIVPEILPSKRVIEDIKPKLKISAPDSWPRLEILPGGVINHLENCEDDLTIYSGPENEDEVRGEGGMMYACAKCSERFQYLFSLVKHVRVHELEKRKRMEPDISTICTTNRVFKKNYVCLKSTKNKLTKAIKKKVMKVPKKSKS